VILKWNIPYRAILRNIFFVLLAQYCAISGVGDKTLRLFEVMPPWLLDLIFVLDKPSKASYLSQLLRSAMVLKNVACA